MIAEFFTFLFSEGGAFFSLIAAAAGVTAIAMVSKQGKQIQDLDSKLTENDVVILRSKIKSRADYFISRGSITSEELEEIDGLYDRYEKLGGNSFIHKKMDLIDKLPIKEDNGNSKAA